MVLKSKRAVTADPLNRLIGEAQRQDAERIAAYRELWQYLWNDRCLALGVPIDTMNTDVRAMVLAFCRDGVPVETAKMITLTWMGGLTK